MVKPVIKPVLTELEDEYRRLHFSNAKDVKNEHFFCSACNTNLDRQIFTGRITVHPLLETLMCRKCYDFYVNGEFTSDYDGYDKYCRMCGQGGTLYLCSTCTGGFCKTCVRRIFTRNELESIEKDDWSCFCCDVTPLYKLRSVCWAATKFLANKIPDGSTKTRLPLARRQELKEIRKTVNVMTNVSNKIIHLNKEVNSKLTTFKSEKLRKRQIDDVAIARDLSSKFIECIASVERVMARYRTEVEMYVKTVVEGKNDDVALKPCSSGRENPPAKRPRKETEADED